MCVLILFVAAVVVGVARHVPIVCSWLSVCRKYHCLKEQHHSHRLLSYEIIQHVMQLLCTLIVIVEHIAQW